MYHLTTHMHFMGIGGIGMSGIAKVLRQQGYTISGCDNNIEQETIKELSELGCKISAGHCGTECNNKKINYLIYSSAIDINHPEIVNAIANKVKVVQRAEMLAELMKSKFSIAVGGSHGKTTTSSLISHILLHNQYDPTIIVGGKLKNLGSNAHSGKSKLMVIEADESDKSIEKLFPSIAVVTNIDLEHLDTFNNINEITNTFAKFLDKLPFYGKAIICNDDLQCQELTDCCNLDFITYGIDNYSNYMARNILLTAAYSEFDLFINNSFINKIKLNIPGKHNVLNSLAAIAVSSLIDIPIDKIQTALKTFQGIERRFSLNGYYKGASIFDDYGHHPKEIEATLEMARLCVKNKLRVVFQPHRYTRTYYLWKDFIKILANPKIDELIITDIYPAGEAEIKNINSQRLINEIIQANINMKATYIPASDNFGKIKEHLDICLEDGDLILILGAGKVHKLANFMATQNARQ